MDQEPGHQHLLLRQFLISTSITEYPFQFSASEESFEAAEDSCRRMGSVVALLIDPEDYEFALRTAVKHFADVADWWTAGVPKNLWPIGAKFSYEDNGPDGIQLRHAWLDPLLTDEDKCLSTTFLLRNSIVRSCSDTLRYVCEKRQRPS